MKSWMWWVVGGIVAVEAFWWIAFGNFLTPQQVLNEIRGKVRSIT